MELKERNQVVDDGTEEIFLSAVRDEATELLLLGLGDFNC
jgi:hypothetical protein